MLEGIPNFDAAALMLRSPSLTAASAAWSCPVVHWFFLPFFMYFLGITVIIYLNLPPIMAKVGFTAKFLA